MPMFIHRLFSFPEEEQPISSETYSEYVCSVCNKPDDSCTCLEQEDIVDRFCDVCNQPPTMCCCLPCPVCGAKGDPACYTEHNMKYTKNQIIASTQAHIAELEDELQYLYQYLEELEMLPDDYETEEEHVLY